MAGGRSVSQTVSQHSAVEGVVLVVVGSTWHEQTTGCHNGIEVDSIDIGYEVVRAAHPTLSRSESQPASELGKPGSEMATWLRRELSMLAFTRPRAMIARIGHSRSDVEEEAGEWGMGV
ncbi:hypothetical protein AXG93_1487s1280 [Marchantia polymorpha subsp. ruderalis]|uniref:Uncharacterized protein n=1 Tax=Marchantia polymorpha subsp. ruderalis TaxID=1480154 RepID=A0A176WQK0_MARPO|nr:hypothetical protein AXG93_1487s1280 [Marchantia polymorpha subsp. ruderalis]